MEVTLDIMVPTFNPEIRLLDQTIESLANFVNANPQSKVTVVDNGSEAPVTQLLSADTIAREGFRFVRFENNLGFSQNLLRASGLADGAWLWFIGDDDLVDSQRGLLEGFDRLPLGTNCLLLKTSFFEDGSQIDWNKWSSQDSFWAGSALSSIVFDRIQFQSQAAPILKATGDELWLHFLVSKALSANKLSESVQSLLPRVAVRTGRQANWEAHFGSQYLAGLDAVRKLAMMASSGLLDLEVARQAFRLRLQSNLGDVAVLSSRLSDEQMRSAELQFREIAKTLSLRFPPIHSHFMRTPRSIRSSLAMSIAQLSKTKAWLAGWPRSNHIER